MGRRARRSNFAAPLAITFAVLIGCGGIAPQAASQADGSANPQADSGTVLDVTIDPSELDGAPPADATLADNAPAIDAPFDAGSEAGEADTDSGTADATPDSASHICVAATCASLGYYCNYASDGCGGLLDCGTCTFPEWCGGGGFNMCGGCNNVCCQPCVDGGVSGGGPCTPLTCASLNYDCGFAADGCGGILMCGTCQTPETCGGGGAPNRCGVSDAGAGSGDGGQCTPLTCADQNITCGPAGDGCGTELMCGVCEAGQTCGGGGVYGRCVQAPWCCVPCTPLTCEQSGVACGPTGDGCGHVIQCGTCTAPQTCGGGGFGKCG